MGLHAHPWTLLRCSGSACRLEFHNVFLLREYESVSFHTNTQYPTVEANCILHGISTHLQYKLHPVLKGLWVGLGILFYYVTLNRGGGSEGREKKKK